MMSSFQGWPDFVQFFWKSFLDEVGESCVLLEACQILAGQAADFLLQPSLFLSRLPMPDFRVMTYSFL